MGSTGKGIMIILIIMVLIPPLFILFIFPYVLNEDFLESLLVVLLFGGYLAIHYILALIFFIYTFKEVRQHGFKKNNLIAISILLGAAIIIPPILFEFAP